MIDYNKIRYYICMRENKFIFYLYRRKEHTSILSMYVLCNPSHDKRKRGRPRLLYSKYIENITGLGEIREIAAPAQDRLSRRGLVVGWCSRTQPI